MPELGISLERVKRLAGLEMNLVLFANLLPREIFEGGRVVSPGTMIHDLSGEVLFHRLPIVKGRATVGYVDIAANSAFAFPLIGASQSIAWDEEALLKQAVSAARKRISRFRYEQARFVAYSYPKIAVQFLTKGEEVVMLETFTWSPVPAERLREREEAPTNFERWSLVKETPPSRHDENAKTYKKHVTRWDDVCPPTTRPRKFTPEILKPADFAVIVEPRVRLDQRELHYSGEDATHHPCFELHGQLTSVWCVAASVQMVLDFYRFNYTQERIAADLGLGTLANPNGLPYSRDGDVVTVLQNLTSVALTASMNTSPTWTEFVAEIKADRPLISFIPGHSRAVAGYTSTRLFTWYLFRGLLVYDPWPPTTGVITQWENFDNMTYRRTFTAHVTLV